MVDVAVRLVEVPVAVVVVPIPDVELREGLRDLRIALAGRRLLRMGPKSALGLPRGVNKLWNQGGLMYSPPVR